MCGIAGALDLNGRPVSEAELIRMRDSMEHRGPDAQGLWLSEDGCVGLAHRRLAIIDLSQSAGQPMSNEDGSVWIVFNGEIYNHAGLRRELERRGHMFRTDHSDTEVIVHAFEDWGIHCVQRFRGMFAFAIWDGRGRELWLVRDRIGIKPLYYGVYDGRFRFASEIKAILTDPNVRRTLNEQALYHYLSFLTTPAPMTLFEGIEKLPGGCFAHVDACGNLRVERYWDVWDHVRPLNGTSGDEIARILLTELRTSVALRKISDVPVGVFLSGGIDSATNAILFASDTSTPVRTFSIGYERDYPSYQSEFPYARLIARLIGAEHHERRIGVDDLLQIMPLIVAHQDEPIADPVCVPLYFVSRLARDAGVIVCQVGEGSDELFWGYPSWKRMLRLQRADGWPVPRAVKRAALSGLGAAGFARGGPYEWLRRAVAGQPVFWGGAEALTEHEKRQLLSPGARRRLDGLTSYEAIRPIWERFQAAAPVEAGYLGWMSYLELNLRLPELLLMRVDKMSMAASVECRVPFLDHEFVTFAMSIPEEVKTRNGELKHILKCAVSGVVPAEVIRRAKQGFDVPISEWLTDRLGPEMRREIVHFAGETDIFDRRAVETWLDRGTNPHAWTLYNLALWWRMYLA